MYPQFLILILSHGPLDFRYFLFQKGKFQSNSVMRYLVSIAGQNRLAYLFLFSFLSFFALERKL